MAAVKCVLIGGGVRAGKSAFALTRARQLGARRVFVATARGLDDEMRERIARHQADRGGDFTTVDEPLRLPAMLRRLSDVDVVVVDCLTMWLANLLVRGDDEAAILRDVDALVAAVREASYRAVLVTNEVGMGVHPEHALGRAFRDVVGRAHQRLAACADEIYFAAMGVMLRLQPGPVEVQRWEGE